MNSKPTEAKVKELIEHGVKILETHNIEPSESYHYEYWKAHRAFLVKQILSHPDLAIMDKNQSFPESPYNAVGGEVNMGYVYARQDLRKTGWEKVIPLAPIIKSMEDEK